MSTNINNLLHEHQYFLKPSIPMVNFPRGVKLRSLLTVQLTSSYIKFNLVHIGCRRQARCYLSFECWKSVLTLSGNIFGLRDWINFDILSRCEINVLKIIKPSYWSNRCLHSKNYSVIASKRHPWDSIFANTNVTHS